MWNREPFFGGCAYYNSGTGAAVEGCYSPANPLEFEADCQHWTANNLPGQMFDSADEAMDASDAA